MGIMDVLNGMQNGPRGMSGRSSGGMSPITMALLGLLAYKAVKHFNSEGRTAPGHGDAQGSNQNGGLGGLLSGLGAGGGTQGLGSALSNGLNDLLAQFRQAGQGDVAKSWVGTGANRPIAPQDLSRVLTPEQIEFLTQRTGMSREELLSALSQHLPGAVDQLTPQGRVPSPQELDQA